jgi:hypothetical protein
MKSFLRGIRVVLWIQMPLVALSIYCSVAFRHFYREISRDPLETLNRQEVIEMARCHDFAISTVALCLTVATGIIWSAYRANTRSHMLSGLDQ